MKNLCLFVVVFILVCVTGVGLELSIGTKGGVGHSSWIGQDYKDYLEANDFQNALNLNIVAGVFATIGLMDFLAIQPELLFAITGDRFKEDVEPLGFDGYVRYFDRLMYLEPAVLVKANFKMFNVFAGPMLMLRLGSGKNGSKADDPSIGDSTADYADDDFTRMLFAATAGLGFSYPLGPGSIVAEVRGQYSFGNVLNDDLYTFIQQQYAVIVLAGYSIPLKK